MILAVRQSLLYCLAFVALGACIGIFGSTIQPLAQKCDTTVSALGAVVTARGAGYVAGSFVAAFALRLSCLHIVITAAMFGAAVATSCIPFLNSVLQLSFGFFGQGFFLGLLDVGGNTLVVWAWVGSEAQLNTWMNALHFSFGVGALASPLLVSQIGADRFGLAYLSVALLLVLGGMLIPVVPPPIPKDDSPIPEDDSQDESGITWDCVAKNGLIIIAGCLFFFYSGIEVGFGTWAGVYGSSIGHTSEDNSALLNSLFWINLTVGRLIAMPVAWCLTAVQMVSMSLVGATTTMLIMLLWGEHPAVTYGAACMLGLSISSMFASLMSIMQAKFKHAELITSSLFICCSIGEMSLPVAIGYIMVGVGPAGLPFCILSCTLVVGAMFGIVTQYPELGKVAPETGSVGVDNSSSIEFVHLSSEETEDMDVAADIPDLGSDGSSPNPESRQRNKQQGGLAPNVK